MARTPIVRFGSVLIATVRDELDDESALQLQSDLGDQVVAHRSHGVLVDISALDIVDSFICKVISDTATIVRILGADVALVGMQPAVAITLVELGLPLNGIATARTVDAGVHVLDERRARGRSRPDGRDAGERRRAGPVP